MPNSVMDVFLDLSYAIGEGEVMHPTSRQDNVHFQNWLKGGAAGA